jgi:hypothetical protein
LGVFLELNLHHKFNTGSYIDKHHLNDTVKPGAKNKAFNKRAAPVATQAGKNNVNARVLIHANDVSPRSGINCYCVSHQLTKRACSFHFAHVVSAGGFF